MIYSVIPPLADGLSSAAAGSDEPAVSAARRVIADVDGVTSFLGAGRTIGAAGFTAVTGAG